MNHRNQHQHRRRLERLFPSNPASSSLASPLPSSSSRLGTTASLLALLYVANLLRLHTSVLPLVGVDNNSNNNSNNNNNNNNQQPSRNSNNNKPSEWRVPVDRTQAFWRQLQRQATVVEALAQTPPPPPPRRVEEHEKVDAATPNENQEQDTAKHSSHRQQYHIDNDDINHTEPCRPPHHNHHHQQPSGLTNTTLQQLLAQPLSQNAKAVPRCEVPSACPVMLLLEEPMVAVVLVVSSSSLGSGTEQFVVDWRHLLVTTFKLLETVDEVWVWMDSSVWGAGLSNTNHTNDPRHHRPQQKAADRLYRARFQPSPDDDKGGPHNKDQRPTVPRLRSHVVANNDWSAAVRQMDQVSDASCFVWMDYVHWYSAETKATVTLPPPPRAAIPDAGHAFVQPRIAAWRRKPFSVHASHALRWDGRMDDSGGSQRGCDHPNVITASVVRVGPDGRPVFQGASAIPFIHGLVHDRAWLCFLQHPWIQQIALGTDWSFFRLLLALWMSHLAGVRALLAPNDDDEDDWPSNYDIDTAQMQAIVHLFGTGPFPDRNVTWEDCGVTTDLY